MKVLLIGSEGFIGTELKLQLINLGIKVIDFNKTEENPLGYMNKLAVANIFALHNFDCVISSAWTTSHSTYRDSNENFQHQAATEYMAFEAKRNSVPIFVALGSAAEYGQYNTSASANLSLLNSVDNYSNAKISTFHSVSEILSSTSTMLIWPRIFQPYGRGQDASRFLPSLISTLDSGAKLEIKNPEHIYDWVHVTDVAKAVIYSIMNGIYGAIDIGTGKGTSNIDLANIASSIFRVNNLVTGSNLNSDIKGLVMNVNTPLLNHGWVPEVTIEAGIKGMVGQKYHAKK